MKRFFLLFFCLLIVSVFPQHQESIEIFNEANELYRLKEYEKSIDLYEKLINRGLVSPELYYNSGNAYYRLGKIGYAILYFEKALRLSPSDEDIIHNLRIANMQKADEVESLPSFFIFDWWNSILLLFSVNGWTVTLFIIYLLFITTLSFYFFSPDPAIQKKALYSSFIISLFLIFSASILIVRINSELNKKEGVILFQEAAVKSAPDYSTQESFEVHEGLKVIVEDKVENWLKIRLPDGKVGWIQKDAIAVI